MKDHEIIQAAERKDFAVLAEAARDGSLEALAERWHSRRQRVLDAVDANGDLYVWVRVKDTIYTGEEIRAGEEAFLDEAALTVHGRAEENFKVSR